MGKAKAAPKAVPKASGKGKGRGRGKRSKEEEPVVEPPAESDETERRSAKRKAPLAPGRAAAKFKAKAAEAHVDMDVDADAIDEPLVAEMIDFAKGFEGMLFSEAKEKLLKERQMFEGNFIFNMCWGRPAVGIKSLRYDREVGYFSLPKQTWNESISICLAAANVLAACLPESMCLLIEILYTTCSLQYHHELELLKLPQFRPHSQLIPGNQDLLGRFGHG